MIKTNSLYGHYLSARKVVLEVWLQCYDLFWEYQ